MMKNKFRHFIMLLSTIMLIIGSGSAFGFAPPVKNINNEAANAQASAAGNPQVAEVKYYGQGFFEVKPNGLRVLHLKGNAYDRGYQYGMLQKKAIEDSLNSGIALYSLMLGQGDYDKGLAEIKRGANEMLPYIPIEYQKEMRGMADALIAQGSNLDFFDIIMWNTVNDCIMLNFEKVLPGFAFGATVKQEPGKRHAYPVPGIGCCTVRASGDATVDGKLIMAKNMDWMTTQEMRDNVLMLVVDPTDGGHGYTTPVYSGWITCIEGANEKGISVGLQISSANDETMSGVGWHFLTNLILKYADSLDDAIEILTVYPRACGNIHHVCDANIGQSVVIEHTADAIAVRYQEKGKNILWTTNHFNCYPGFMGYEGPNMVALQDKKYGLKDISTIKKWQKGLNTTVKWSNGRFWRFNELLNENYGKITVEKMITFMRDRLDYYTRKQVSWNEFGDTISFGADQLIPMADGKPVPYYKSGKTAPVNMGEHNIFCLVVTPGTGDVRAALAGPMPAQRGEFKAMNLFDELARMR